MIRYCALCGVHLCEGCRRAWTERIVKAFVSAILGRWQDTPDRCYICRRTAADLIRQGVKAASVR